MPGIPVVEVGGTHATSSLVCAHDWQVAASATGVLHSDDNADAIIAAIASVIRSLPLDAPAHWGAAVPGPFDYSRGVAHYTGVGKFDSLNGIDVSAELRRRLPDRISHITFSNDADALLLGAWATGQLTGHRRCMAITLGSGVGSSFLVDGRIVHDGPGVPPDGEVHLLTLYGVPLEDLFSRRTIRGAFAAQTDEYPTPDVAEIFARARHGDAASLAVVTEAVRALCLVLAPVVRDFGASVVLVAGSIARSWDLIEGPLRRSLSSSRRSVAIVRCAAPDATVAVGAACVVAKQIV